MNFNSFSRFLDLVADVRKAQRAYWDNRSNDNLAASLKLETRLDAYIKKCSDTLAARPQYKPEASAYGFFVLVATWRDRFKNFFKYKKSQEADARVVKEMYIEIKDFEKAIDDALSYLDKQMKQNINQKQ